MNPDRLDDSDEVNVYLHREPHVDSLNFESVKREDCMRVVVDFELCESNAVCMVTAPEVFEVLDDDSLVILEEHPPEELREKVVLAAQRCPKRAITIEG